MSDKKTACPSCTTVYKVTVAQLTVSQGMVCCPKCSTSFNALSYLVADQLNTDAESAAESQHNRTIRLNTPGLNLNGTKFNFQHIPAYGLEESRQLLKIFDDKVENSNIDLKTYLNNLNYFSTEPIGNFPAVNWTENSELDNKRHSISFILWIVVNALLISLLLFQFFWFNPQYLKKSPIMSKAFNTVCEVFNCEKLEEKYDLITTKKIKIRAVGDQEVEFSGQLINYHDHSLNLPIIRVHLELNGAETAVFTLHADDYLHNSLSGIQRIPSNSPFEFDFKLPKNRKSFNSYDLEIIRP